MKIILISSLYGVEGGGAGRMARYLAHGLRDLGHHVSVITLGDDRRYSVVVEEDIRVYRFKPWNLYPLDEKDDHSRWQKIIWQVLDIFNMYSAHVLRRIFETELPDIVHVHKMRGFSGAVWTVAARHFPGRVIQTCHDYESMSPDGLLRGSIGRMALQKKWPVRGYQLVRRRLTAGVSIVTAPSAATLKRIMDSGLFPFAQAKVIANTHGWSHDELKGIHEKVCISAARQIRFLFMGRLESEKGIIELCEAFLEACTSHPMHLDIAGWGTLDAGVRQKYGKHPRIHFCGALDGQARERAFADAAVVVVPSLVEEVFGLVVIESFAFGKPVIASHIGGLPELVQHGETGWLVEPANVKSLAQQMLSVAQIDPSMMAKMSQTCKEYSYRFTIEKILSEYLLLYDHLLR